MTENKSNNIVKGSKTIENEYNDYSKWVVKDYSDIEASRIDEVSQKQKIKETILSSLTKGLENAQKSINEYSLPKFKQIFAPTKNNKTQIILRYGSSIFYHGIVDDSIVAKKEKNSLENESDNFGAKKYILNGLIDSLNNNKWFDEQYAKFDKKRNEAKSKAKATRTKNKTTKKKVTKKSETKPNEMIA